MTNDEIRAALSSPGPTRFSFFGHCVDDAMLERFPDGLVLKDNRGGELVVRKRTERITPVPTPRQAA